MNQYDASGLLITYSENILWSNKYYIIFKLFDFIMLFGVKRKERNYN